MSAALSKQREGLLSGLIVLEEVYYREWEKGPGHQQYLGVSCTCLHANPPAWLCKHHVTMSQGGFYSPCNNDEGARRNV